MDVLSDVLSLLKPRNYMYGGFDMGGDLSIRFPRHQGIKCYTVVSGQCYLSVEGLSETICMTAGECFLLPRGWPFRLASDPSLSPVDFYDVLPPGRSNGSIVTINGGGNFFIVGGYFMLDGHHANILLESLPPVVHIQEESDQAALRWSIERMMLELREPQPGSLLVTEHLTSVVLIQALRTYLAAGGSSVGWLFALADKQMGAAISAIHEDPAHPWTVQTLAERAYMSRSTFALKFKTSVGLSPMDYLTRWRMMLAADRLTNSGDSVSTISLSLGYESESAFSTAFKRVMGCSPRQYSQGQYSVSAA